MDPLTVFEILIKLQPGDTLCSDLTIVEHNTWFSSFKRMLSGDTKFTTVELIETVVTDYCKEKESTNYLRTKEIKMLEQVRTGIKNLGDTYANTPIDKRLEQCHQQLRELMTSKRERSSSSDEEHPRTPSDSSSEEFELDEKEEQLSTTVSGENTHTPPSYSLPVVPPKPKKEEDPKKSIEIEKDDIVCPKQASKFDKFVKKKGWIGSRRASGSSEFQGHEFQGHESDRVRGVSRSRRKSSPSTRNLPGLHIITMGDVLSEFDTLPETVSNPLSVLSHPSKPRDVTWYREHFVRK